MNVWNTLWDRPLSQWTTSDEIIDLSYVNHTLYQAVWQTFTCRPERVSDPSYILELEVARRFKAVAKVHSIYTNNYMGRKQFLILTSNEKYDDELMDQLLSIEYEFHLEYMQTPVRFAYIPRLFESLNEVVPRESTLVYERDWDVILCGTLASGQTQRELSCSTAE